MPARLSSLLVRDGLVGVKRMEKAFQRQVIYGGCLDTILLEMGLVPEDRLVQYLALASGLPPAAREEGEVIEPAALALISREVAEKHRAIPLAIDDDAVRVLVCAPLEIGELEDLADLIDRALQPLITPEYRWHLVLAAAYDLDPPARFTTLARALDVDPAIAPVGRARSVIVDEKSTGAPIEVMSDVTARTPQPVPMHVPAGAEDETPRLPSRLPSEPTSERMRRVTIVGVKPNRASTDAGTLPPRAPAAPGESGPTRVPGEPAAPAPAAAGPHAPQGPVAEPRARRPSHRGPAVKRAQTAPITTSGRDSPLAIVPARELLAIAPDRDTVFLTLLRAARSRARWAGLFTVQGGAAIGRVALAEPGIDVQAVHSILVPLDVVSPFRTVVANHQPHIGSLVSGDPSIDSMVLRMGGAMPPSALLLPIVLRDRVVALVVAHRGHADIRLADVTELLPMATAASDALGRLIVKHKSAGYRAPAEAPVVEVEADAMETRKMMKAPAEWSVPERPSAPAYEPGTEVSIVAEPARPIEEVMREIERAPESHAEDALAEAVERVSETLGALMRMFPGKLRVDRFAVAGRPLRAAQYGGLLELAIRLGAAAAELLIDKMSDAHRDVRFYATVCAAELRPRNAVFALVERLFDQDFGVRACAIEALAGYPLGELGQALMRARRAVHSSDPEVVGAATSAIVTLGDTDAVPDLIGVLERGDRSVEHARRALVQLTAQDFGTSERKWRKWYDAARARHRIEWLIDGLVHKEDAIRAAAINDLRRLTGEYFGYHHDLPRRERDAAASRWTAWWREAGHRRFVLREDERARPTAQLPARRE